MSLRGAIAAAVTPLDEGGAGLDEAQVAPMVSFLAEHGCDGILVAGTTGEGVLLTLEERRRLLERVLASRPNGFLVAAHCGAQSTADTVALAQHARATGADGVAVIAPPYFPLDAEEIFKHLMAAARAAAPVPFYVYEFRARSGYAIPVEVVHRLTEEVENFVGMKVSDTPWEAIEPYLIDGLDIFVGSEPLVLHGLTRGIAGAVSGLAAAFPEVVAALDKGYRWSTSAGADSPVLTRKVLGRLVIANYEPWRLTNEERRRLNEEIQRFPSDSIFVDIRPGHPGGDWPMRGMIQLRSFNAIIGFVARAISEEPGFHVDPDPRSGPVTMNPDKVLEIEELTVAPREAEFSVAFEGTHYSISRFPISGGMVPSWNQEAFAVLANLFQMTVTDVSNAKAPIISISKGS